MRDIRHDLRERLAAINGRYADEMVQYDESREALDREHKLTIAALDRERTLVEQLLSIEEQRDGTMPSPVQRTARLMTLADFLITKVHAHGPMDKDELRAEANLAGYFAEGNGRTFHTTLMNIAKHGKLTHLPDGRYAFPTRPPDTLFGVGTSTEENGMLM